MCFRFAGPSQLERCKVQAATCNVQRATCSIATINQIAAKYVCVYDNERQQRQAVHRVTVNSYQLTVNIDHVVLLSNEPLEQGRRRRVATA